MSSDRGSLATSEGPRPPASRRLKRQQILQKARKQYLDRMPVFSSEKPSRLAPSIPSSRPTTGTPALPGALTAVRKKQQNSYVASAGQEVDRLIYLALTDTSFKKIDEILDRRERRRKKAQGSKDAVDVQNVEPGFLFATAEAFLSATAPALPRERELQTFRRRGTVVDRARDRERN
eukprot:RCo050691